MKVKSAEIKKDIKKTTREEITKHQDINELEKDMIFYITL